jgi:hypothetical protein
MAYPLSNPIPAPRPPEVPRAAGGARGFRISNDDSLRAQQPALIAERGFVVNELSMGSIGEAIGDAGGQASRLVQAQFESINRRKVEEASDLLRLAQDDLARRFAEEPDESKWIGIAQSELPKWEKSLLSDRELSLDARDAIQGKFNLWRSSLLGDPERGTPGHVVIQAAARSHEREGEHYMAQLVTARQGNDWQGAEDATKKLQDHGFIAEDEAARQRGQTQVAQAAAAKQLAENSVIQSVREFGLEKTLDVIADPKFGGGVIDEGDRERLKDMARAVDRDVVSTAVNEVANYLATNPTASPADVEREAGGRLPPAELEKWKTEANERLKDKVQAHRALPEVIDANYARLLDEAEKFDRTAPNAKEEYTRIHREAVALLPEGLRGEITGPIERKWRASLQPPDPPDALKSAITGMASSMFDAGTLGRFKKEPRLVQREGSDGTMRDFWVTETDPEIEQKALAKKGALLIYMGKWAAANPNATPEQAREVMTQFLDGSAPVIRFTPPPATPAIPEANPPTLDDLDGSGGGGGPASILLPPLDYDPIRPLPQ